MSGDEIFNFMSIYLMCDLAENNYEKGNFLFKGRNPINRFCWIVLYLQETGDYKYVYLLENMGEGINHP